MKRSLAFIVGIVVSSVALLGAVVLSGKTVHAQFNTAGRQFGHTFFSDQNRQGCGTWNFNVHDINQPLSPTNFKGIVYDPNSTRAFKAPTENTVVNADIFIKGFRDRLYSQYDFDQARAAAIIALFMGVDATDKNFDKNPGFQRWQNGVVWARDNFDKFDKLIRSYDKAGQVNFNTPNIYDGVAVLDWMGSNGDDCNEYNNIPDTHYEYVGTSGEDRAAIFTDKKGQPLIVILLKCANVLGNAAPLQPPTPPPPPPQPKVECNAMSALDTIAVGQTVQLKPSVKFTDYNVQTGANRPVLNMWVKDPMGAVRTFSNLPYTTSGTPPNGTLTGNMDFTPNTGGKYQMQWYVVFPDNTSLNITCPGVGQAPAGTPSSPGTDPKRSPGTGKTYDVLAGYQPYFGAKGGDIVAGSQGGAAADIIGWNGNGVGGYSGAGGDLAGLASGSIISFTTGSGMNSITNDALASGLAFANTNDVRNSSVPEKKRYGGGFGALPDILNPSYANPTSMPNPSGPVDVGSLQSGVYQYDTDIMIGGNVPAGRNVTIIVTPGHNVLVRDDINYTYGNFNEIPRLTVVVRSGNIAVLHSVSEMHGVYLAQTNDQTKGRFYTCANGMNSPVDHKTDAFAFDKCNNPLKIYGSVAANKFILGRVSGHWNTPGSNPAEQFIYSPEVWLSRPANSGNTSGGSTRYDSYITLSPVL